MASSGALRRVLLTTAILAVAVVTTPETRADSSAGQRLKSIVPRNAFAFIPPQCYTRTRDAAGGVHNPCYTCHINSAAPNYVKDGDLQLSYDFPGTANENAWTNLFVDRRAAIATTDDADILAYVGEDNYHGADGRPALADRLKTPPADWDINGDGRWDGYVPDISFRFDAEGYDLDANGQRDGWRAYAYMPLPGAFLPTNGSADDVAIRLPKAFLTRRDGTLDWGLYAVNLAIVEALVKRADVPLPPTDETEIGLDLDRDGRLATADHVAFAFDPRKGVTMAYGGQAGEAVKAGTLHLAAGLFPEGTEFVHTLRYLDVAADGSVGPSPRLKELRYARKTGWRTYMSLLSKAMDELREEHDNPDRPELFLGDIESGISTGQGWRFQGFIEEAGGALRPQTYEESMTCAGCHAGVGATVDNTFSYGRRIDGGPASGWYAWGGGDRSLGALADRTRPDGAGEYATYLARNGAADEFRANDEATSRFYPGGLRDDRVFEELRRRIGVLADPSARRALDLDKAYRLVVREQSYDKGRQPVLEPLGDTVWHTVETAAPTGIETPVQ